MLLADDLTQVSWRCLHFTTSGEEVTLRAKLEGVGLSVFEIHGTALHTEEQLLIAIAKEMKFPEYFGLNWDALDECLCDMASWLPSKGYVLFFHDAEEFWQRSSRIAGMFVESWLYAAEEWGRENAPFHLVFLWEDAR